MYLRHEVKLKFGVFKIMRGASKRIDLQLLLYHSAV